MGTIIGFIVYYVGGDKEVFFVKTLEALKESLKNDKQVTDIQRIIIE